MQFWFKIYLKLTSITD